VGDYVVALLFDFEFNAVNRLQLAALLFLAAGSWRKIQTFDWFP